jgi:hypothetical protein
MGFSWIVPDSRGLLLINRNPLSMSLKEMAFVMKSLFDRGYMLAISQGDLTDVYHREEKPNLDLLIVKGFIPSLLEIEAALKAPERPELYESEELNYFLTAEGGKVWELLSQANWNKYIESGNVTDKTWLKAIDVEIRGIDVDRISNYLQLYHILCPFDEDYHPILEAQLWTKIEPIQFFYWKIFPWGYKVNCQLGIKTINQEDKLVVHDRGIYNSVFKLMGTWYQDYYQMP